MRNTSTLLTRTFMGGALLALSACGSVDNDTSKVQTKAAEAATLDGTYRLNKLNCSTGDLTPAAKSSADFTRPILLKVNSKATPAGTVQIETLLTGACSYIEDFQLKAFQAGTNPKLTLSNYSPRYSVGCTADQMNPALRHARFLEDQSAVELKDNQMSLIEVTPNQSGYCLEHNATLVQIWVKSS